MKNKQVEFSELYRANTAAPARGGIRVHAAGRPRTQREFQATMARDIVWRGFGPPMGRGRALGDDALPSGGSAGPCLLSHGVTIVVSFVIVQWGKQRASTSRYEPRGSELESLRTKLAGPQALNFACLNACHGMQQPARAVPRQQGSHGPRRSLL